MWRRRSSRSSGITATASVRKHARFKYTIDDRGLDWFKDELNERLGWKLEEARPYHFEHNGDRYGWVKGSNGKWHLYAVHPERPDQGSRTTIR